MTGAKPDSYRADITDHYSEAIQAAAEAIHEAGWTCEAHEPLGLEKCGQCETSTTELARKTLTAALPHIRAMIATDMRAERTPDLIYLANRYQGFHDGLREGLERAARIAEEGHTK